MKNVQRIFIFAGFFLLCHLALVLGAGWRATYAESNYYRNMQRLEDFLTSPCKNTVLIGSSIAARVHPDEFKKDLGFVNLGLDGTVALTGLTVLQRDGSKPKTLLVELSHVTIIQSTINDVLVLGQQTAFTRWLWRLVPSCRPSARPSSMAYSLLKRGKEKAADPAWLGQHQLRDDECGLSVPVIPSPSEEVFRRVQTNLLVKGLCDLQKQGTRVMFVKIPLGKDHAPSVEAWQAAVYLKSPVIDLETIAKSKGVTLRYTDGVHLDRASAQICSFWLANILKANPTN